MINVGDLPWAGRRLRRGEIENIATEELESLRNPLELGRMGPRPDYRHRRRMRSVSQKNQDTQRGELPNHGSRLRYTRRRNPKRANPILKYIDALRISLLNLRFVEIAPSRYESGRCSFIDGSPYGVIWHPRDNWRRRYLAAALIADKPLPGY